MAQETLLTAQAAGVLTLTLNRPKALNALTPELLEALLRALKEAAESPGVRCVVLAGAGRAFCAGFDAAALEKRRRDASWTLGAELRRSFHPVLLRIRSMEKPVVASVNGPAAGCGASLALACDLKVVSEDAGFVCSWGRAGLLLPGLSGPVARQLGFSRALEHAWTGKPLGSREALAIGLVNVVVPAYRVESATFALAAKLLEAAPRSVALAKRAVNRSVGRAWEEELEYEAQLQDLLGPTKDCAEGLAAFLEKRSPVFTGE